jgi:hypothetical protein
MLATLRNRLHENFVRWALRVRPPEPAPIVLSQRRVYVLPTPAGLAYTSALGVILLGAMNYNLSLGHALVFLLAGLGIVTILHTFRNLVQLIAESGALRAGLCRRAGSFRPGAWTIHGRMPAPACACSSTMARRSKSTSAPSRQPQSPACGLHTEKRGWLPMPRVTIETTWPLGLVRAWSYAAPDLACLVYPLPAAKAPMLPWSGD